MSKSLKVGLTLIATLVMLVLVAVIGPRIDVRLQLDETAFLRFAFVGIGLLIVFITYWLTQNNDAWVVGTREVVFMAVGAALYAVFSFLFNASVFAVPSVSQVALRPAIVFPMFFGYIFGPTVGFFTGAIGNVFGDAISGYGLSPQWCIGNGLLGMISGFHFLFKNKKQSINILLWVSGAITLIITVLFLLNIGIDNKTYFDTTTGVYGETQMTIFAGLTAIIGFAIVLGVKLLVKNENIATAITWATAGNILGIGFAAISDIWINGFSLPVAVIGEFLPAAGTNMLFAAILLPLIVVAYESIQKQSGR